MRKILTAIMIFILAGCAGTSSLQRSLEDGRGELLYVQDSMKVDKKNGESVAVASFAVDDCLPPQTTVTRTKSSVLPFIFFNTWNHEFQCKLGYGQLANDYKQFIKESFIDELKRSCKVQYVEKKADMEVHVNVKSIEMSAPIKKNGRFLFLFYAAGIGTTTYAGPADVIVKADAVLKKGDREVFAKEFQGRHRTNILKGKNVKMKDYTIAMIEGLSLAVKDMNEQIVREINQI